MGILGNLPFPTPFGGRIAVAVLEGAVHAAVANASHDTGNTLKPSEATAVAGAVMDSLKSDARVQKAVGAEPILQSAVAKGTILGFLGALSYVISVLSSSTGFFHDVSVGSVDWQAFLTSLFILGTSLYVLWGRFKTWLRVKFKRGPA